MVLWWCRCDHLDAVSRSEIVTVHTTLLVLIALAEGDQTHSNHSGLREAEVCVDYYVDSKQQRRNY